MTTRLRSSIHVFNTLGRFFSTCIFLKLKKPLISFQRCHSCMYLQTYIRAAASENQQYAHAKPKAQTSYAVTAQLISTFVFVTRIVQFLFYLNPKFQAFNSASLTVQSGWCQTWSETPTVGFIIQRLIPKLSSLQEA